MVEIKCSKCKEETTHYAKGMCLLCYKREEFKRKYKTDPEFKRKRLESQKRYRDKNKGSMMKYFRIISVFVLVVLNFPRTFGHEEKLVYYSKGGSPYGRKKTTY